ncbi:MAG: hypothetical protein PHD53_05120 [Methylococcales bacterium]|nr:hypothetical protein [Methylococcales bacterium]
MAENATVDDLTITYEDNGIKTVKELDKKVLTKGAWATLMFRYKEWNATKGEYSDDKFTIRRYQKRDGSYQQKSKFNISSVDQAKSMIEILQEWTKE